MSGRPVDVLAVLEQTSTGLWSVANNCTRSDLSTAMRARAEEFDRSRAAVAELVREADLIADALAQDGRTPAGMTKAVAAKRLRAALRSFNGGAQ